MGRVKKVGVGAAIIVGLALLILPSVFGFLAWQEARDAAANAEGLYYETPDWAEDLATDLQALEERAAVETQALEDATTVQSNGADNELRKIRSDIQKMEIQRDLDRLAGERQEIEQSLRNGW